MCWAQIQRNSGKRKINLARLGCDHESMLTTLTHIMITIIIITRIMITIIMITRIMIRIFMMISDHPHHDQDFHDDQ